LSTAATVEIVSASRADLGLVHRLMHGLAVYERLEHAFVASEADLGDALFGPHPVAEAFLGKLDGRAVGYALIFTTFSTFAGKRCMWLEDLFVEPEARGHGVGRALLVRLAQISVERGYARLEWNVLDWNEPAIGFYKSLGAVPMNEWTTFRLAGDSLRRVAAAP
jgi:GNAT superfamily N-acetyltransferase